MCRTRGIVVSPYARYKAKITPPIETREKLCATGPTVCKIGHFLSFYPPWGVELVRRLVAAGLAGVQVYRPGDGQVGGVQVHGDGQVGGVQVHGPRDGQVGKELPRRRVRRLHQMFPETPPVRWTQDRPRVASLRMRARRSLGP